ACEKLKAHELISAPLECSLIGFRISKAAQLSSPDLVVLALKYKDASPKIAKFLHFMASQAMHVSNSKNAMRLFVEGGKVNRNKHLDKVLSVEFVKAIESSYYTNKALERIALSTSLESLPKSILTLDPSILSAHAAFFYALVAIKNSREDLAKIALLRASKTYQSQIDIDKSNFWLWLLTKEKTYFNALKASKHINLYTIYFREKNNLPFLDLAYKTSAHEVPHSKALSKKKASDAFFYKKFLDRLKGDEDKQKMLKEFGAKAGEPFRALIYSKMNDHKIQYLIHPWKKQLSHLSKRHQALILALGRQESNFIPCALSRSYAIGAMQMMPFLIRSIAR
ncbi:MAG: hypothetical protein CSA19_02345, partial [Deltaproteobacteria bacterium]